MKDGYYLISSRSGYGEYHGCILEKNGAKIKHKCCISRDFEYDTGNVNGVISHSNFRYKDDITVKKEEFICPKNVMDGMEKSSIYSLTKDLAKVILEADKIDIHLIDAVKRHKSCTE